jgi:hypothetical protein
MQFIQHVNLYWLTLELIIGVLVVVLLLRYSDKIIAWLKSKNWSTKTVLSGAAGLAAWVAFDPGIQGWLKTSLAAHPQLAAFIVLGSIALAKQSHSSSDAGTLATARAIKAAPDTPTVAQVDAADTTTVK